MSVTGVLAMLVVFNLVYTFLSTPAGSLSDRIGRKKMIAAGWLVYALVYLGVGVAQQAWQIFALHIVYGFYYALAYSTAKAMVADLVPPAARGKAFGLLGALEGGFLFPASLLTGWLWDATGSPAVPLLVSAALSVVAAAWLILFVPRPPLR